MDKETETRMRKRIQEAVINELLAFQDDVKKRIPAIVMSGVRLQDDEQVMVDTISLTTVYDLLGEAVSVVSGTAEEMK